MPNGDFLKVGVSGLQVFQRTLNTIGHNISNVNTEGYSRQVTDLTSRAPTPSGAGFIGNGVRPVTTRRLFDEYAVEQFRSRSATTNFFDVYNQFSSQVDNLVADADAGLAPAIESFFDSVQVVADDPSSIPARNVMLTEAEALVDRFKTMDSWFSDLQRAANDKINSEVLIVNELAASIADYNHDIIIATGIGGGQPPNDLLDKRDQLINDLSKHVNLNVVESLDGSKSIFIGNGQSLVLATRAMQLSSTPNIEDPVNREVAYVDPVSGAISNISDLIGGGELGGVLQFRSDVLMPSINHLGRVALAIGSTFNTQHIRGMDLTDNIGTDFFNYQTLPSLIIGDPPVPRLYATDGVNNVGAATINVRLNDIQALTTDEYELTFDGANYVLRNLNSNQTTNLVIAVAGPPIQFNPEDGMDIELSAVPAVGDTFYIRPNRVAARDLTVAITDPNLIAAAHPLRTGADVTSNSGGATISDATITNYQDLNLLEPVTITFRESGGATYPATADVYDVVGVGTGNPVGTVYVDGGTISFNGWDVQISGTPVVGDVFTIDPNFNGVSDNRNALELANLQTSGTMIGGNATYHEAYSELVVLVGNETHQSEISYEAQNALLGQAEALRDSISGVNLDEEAANLLKYQQAYSAAAQVIAAADQVFQTLINAVRR